ncbi:MAG: hypothetical protein OES99_09595, partial [Gammaproteobacteria bacterium]|nr:hypothetical protein [Gammaproteobacteria bacterium]
MKKTIVLLLASGFLSGALASTQAGTLAKVDGTDITEEMFEAFSASRTRKPSADLTPEEKAALSDYWL